MERVPAISIVMPCYNGARYISTSVESVLRQSFTSFELIIVNDGSTDDSSRILDTIGDDRMIVVNQANTGVIGARNKGLSLASAEYVAFLDADDTWDRDFLSKMYQALQVRAGACLAYCGWQNVGVTGPRGEPFIPPNYENQKKIDTLLEGCRWPIHAVLARRKNVIAVGGFDQRFLTGEDYWLWLRMALFRPIVQVPEVLAYYRHHGTQRSTERNRALKGINTWKMRLELLKDYPDIKGNLGRRRVRQILYGALLQRAYQCYWDEDLVDARTLFRIVMKHGYGTLADWKYMLPALLPFPLHKRVLRVIRRDG